jgi:hypothetical protein
VFLPTKLSVLLKQNILQQSKIYKNSSFFMTGLLPFETTVVVFLFILKDA